MEYYHLRRRLRRSVSFLSAIALVLPAVPGLAKASKVSEIQCSKPLSEKGKTVKSTLTIKKGKSFQIKTKYAGKKLVYKSSKKKVAVVSAKGKIKAKKIGKTKITVSPKGNKKVKAVITVTVVKSLKKVKKIKLNKTSLSLEQGKTGQLKATIVSPKKPTTKKINWFSSDKKIASVNKKGVVTAKSTGTATITVAAADGQGAKASCKVTVVKPAGGIVTGGGVTKQPSVSPSGNPIAATPTPSSGAAVTLTPVPDDKAATVSLDAGGLEVLKQGQVLQLTAKNADTGAVLGGVQWEVSGSEGVTISDAGVLTIAKDAQAGATVKVTVKNASSSDSKDFKIIENKIPELKGNQILINEDTAENPLGLTYRTGSNGEKAFSRVIDPERGEVVKFDSTVGYTSSSYDVLAWIDIDPAYAGKTVTIAAYMKYEAKSDIDKENMNLVINERWGYTNPAKQWAAKEGEWYYITGTFTFPGYDTQRWGNNQNRLYIAKDSDLSTAQAIYYLDGLSFIVEKADVENVEVSTEDDQTEVFQNHDLQCTAKVSGTGNPSQLVTWSIDPPVTGASISQDGILSVKDAVAGSEINIKATSKEDTTKSATKKVTVLAQTIDSITVSAKDDQTEIYQNNELQFSAALTSTGDPSEDVIWSVTPSDKVEITEDGVLKVGNVAGGTELTVKATSVFDTTKSGEYKITVLANKVNAVTVQTAGDKKSIEPGEQMNISAKVDVTGTPSQDITWSLGSEIEGVSLTTLAGSNTVLTVGEKVANGTSITIRATSDFDSTKYGEITIEVASSSTDEFDFNKLSVSYWEDFNSLASTFSSDVISYQSSESEISYTHKLSGAYGVDIMDSSLSALKRATKGIMIAFADEEKDYLQFKISNESDNEKTYLLSFMIHFYQIGGDTTKNLIGVTEYKLPLKLVSIDENGQETVLEEKMELSFPCLTGGYNREFREVFANVKVPAGKSVCLQIKMAGDLPMCQNVSGHSSGAYENTKHPIEIVLDNVALSSNGDRATITMKKGEKQTLQLDKLEGDNIEYYTNCYLAKFTHESKDNTNNCPNFGEETLVATVDENGEITALNAGETILIAVITHGDGTIERKQCIVCVDN